MTFLNRVKKALQRFFAGRYGTDSLNRAIMIFWVILAVINLFLQSLILSVVELTLCLLACFRMLSKNHTKRRRENVIWYSFTQKITLWYRHVTVRFRERKTTRFFSCPHCKAPIRMPRKVGVFRIHCPKCRAHFQKTFKR